MQINVTMWAGIAAFGVAALLAWVAARGSRREATAWRAIAVANGLLVIEMVANLRHRLHGMVARLFEMEGFYGARRGPQALMLVLLAAGVAAIAVSLVGRMRRAGGPARIAALLTMLTLALFGAEIISLHQVDRLLYARIGPMMTIAWSWLALGFGTAALALASTGRRG